MKPPELFFFSFKMCKMIIKKYKEAIYENTYNGRVRGFN